jgi:hypothetical protein
MFEHQNSGKNQRKRIKKLVFYRPRAYKVLIYVKKNSKLSHACVPLRFSGAGGWKRKEGFNRPS